MIDLTAVLAGTITVACLIMIYALILSEVRGPQ